MTKYREYMEYYGRVEFSYALFTLFYKFIFCAVILLILDFVEVIPRFYILILVSVLLLFLQPFLYEIITKKKKFRPDFTFYLDIERAKYKNHSQQENYTLFLVADMLFVIFIIVKYYKTFVYDFFSGHKFFIEFQIIVVFITLLPFFYTMLYTIIKKTKRKEIRKMKINKLSENDQKELQEKLNEILIEERVKENSLNYILTQGEIPELFEIKGEKTIIVPDSILTAPKEYHNILLNIRVTYKDRLNENVKVKRKLVLCGIFAVSGLIFFLIRLLLPLILMFVNIGNFQPMSVLYLIYILIEFLSISLSNTAFFWSAHLLPKNIYTKKEQANRKEFFEKMKIDDIVLETSTRYTKIILSLLFGSIRILNTMGFPNKMKNLQIVE